MYVRISCALIIKINGVIILLLRVGEIQKDNWVIIIKVIFITINIFIDGLIELNLDGSNDEKISDIIQNMEYPIITLKVISLINLMFYLLGWISRLSHKEDVIGFII